MELNRPLIQIDFNSFLNEAKRRNSETAMVGHAKDETWSFDGLYMLKTSLFKAFDMSNMVLDGLIGSNRANSGILNDKVAHHESMGKV